jgi:hypothetical protein
VESIAPRADDIGLRRLREHRARCEQRQNYQRCRNTRSSTHQITKSLIDPIYLETGSSV